MARGRANSKGMLPNGRKQCAGGFLKAPHAVFDHPDYIRLSPASKAFLWDFSRQFNGRNNGNLSGAHGVMKSWGWNKKAALKCRKELEAADWIRVTRYPKAKRQPVLYRLSWLDVDSWEGAPLLDPDAKTKRRSLKS